MTESDFNLLVSKTHIAIYVDDVKPNIDSALIDLINCSLFKKTTNLFTKCFCYKCIRMNFIESFLVIISKLFIYKMYNIY